jgi:tRNA U34 5-methylaminomethyl-2-thiouridine-forming methyltransferase MnmC
VLSKIKDNESVSILEVGFGTGLGFKATLLELGKALLRGPPKEKNIPKELYFISTEIDELLSIHFLKELKKEKYIESFEVNNQERYIEAIAPFSLKKPDSNEILLRGELRVLIGNARESILEVQKSSTIPEIDCFYHDPFSPKKNPILWTTEFFKTLYDISSENSALSTYSSTKAIWKAMMEAGWSVREVRGYGNKKLSTRAYSKGDSSPFVLEQCEKSPLEALSDSGLSKGLDPFL